MTKKRVTLKMLADLLGLSTSAVSRALTDHYTTSLKTRTRVKLLAEKMGYRPNLIARAVRNGSTKMIGLILPSLDDFFYSRMVQSIHHEAHQKGYTVITFLSEDDSEIETSAIEKMRQLHVEGLMILVAKQTTDFELLYDTQREMPIVFLDYLPPLPHSHSVCSDIATSTEQAVAFLVEKGHTQIGLINGLPDLWTSQERSKGFFKGLQNAGLSPIDAPDIYMADGETAILSLLEFNPSLSAIIVFNNYIALAAIKRLKSIEHDPISFIGASAPPIFDFIEDGPLATIEENPEKMGQVATQALLDLIESEAGNNKSQKIVIGAELVERSLAKVLVN